MKKFFPLLVAFVAFSLPVFSQQELVDQLSICSYAGKSYLFTKEVKLTATSSCSFTFTATGSTSFFIRPASATRVQSTVAPSADRNFVRTETVRIQGVTTDDQVSNLSVDQKTTKFDYWDGFARVYQSVVMRASPLKSDMISATYFDNMGNRVKEYLPYVNAQNNGALRSQYDSESKAFYTSTAKVATEPTYPFAQTSFEQSSLKRPISTLGPGSDWVANSKKQQKFSFVDASGAIIRWTYVDDATAPTMSAYDTLIVNVNIDEENNVERTFADKRGLTVLRQSLESGDYITNPGSTTWFSTYYVYDDMGLLRVVIPPEAVSRLATEYITDNSVKTRFLRRWCFQYRYDINGNTTEKWVPGWTDWQYIIYDRWNRERLSQTPAQRERNEWTFIKYDRYNRQVMTGLWITSTPYSTIKSDLIASTPRFETSASTSDGYTLTTTYPSGIVSANLISLTYYDNYDFLGYANWDPQGNTAYNATTVSGVVNSADFLSSPIGKETGSKIKILGSSTWLNNVTRYDGKYRKVQVIGKNNLGGMDRISNKYTYTGQNATTQIYHTSSVGSTTLLREFEFDHTNRLLATFQTIDSGPRILISANRYNEIGQVVEKNIHSYDNGTSFLQSIDYRYNIRGWLTHINNSSLTNDGVANDDSNDLFGMELMYNPASPPAISGYPLANVPRRYDGGITSMKWKVNTLEPGVTPVENIYGFKYDKLSRLEKAYYASNNTGAWSGDVGMFNEAIKSYDKNGNIQGIERNGRLNGAIGTVDNTTYSYDYTGTTITNFTGVSNRLLAVSDAGTSFGFKDATAQVWEEYKYDASGNMIYDHNKSLSKITYNHLNLPQVVELTRSSGAIDRVIFTYDAAGTKLKKQQYRDGNTSSNGTLVYTTEYDGDFQYGQPGNDTRQLNFVLHPEGRAVKKDGTFSYEYFHKDHLGNVRLSYSLSKEFDSYRATMEDPPSPSQLGAKENTTFENISSTRYADPTFNFTAPSTEITNPQRSSLTNSYMNKPLGPALSLHLNAGDVVNMEVMAKYSQPTNGTATIDPALFITALATTTFGYSVGEVAYNSFNSNALGIPGIGGATSTLPKAYLAYIFFDENYEYVPSGSSAVAISTAAYNSFEKLTRSFTAPQSGYLYIYVANESKTTTSNVYFDEMYVSRLGSTAKLQVIQSSDYYPFGLTFNSYQRENSVDQKFKFQGQEHIDDLNLGWDSFKWRNHQPEIGRFFNIDPLADKYVYNSPYAFSENQVVAHRELEGLEKVLAIYYHGGPFGSGNATTAEKAGPTGQIFNNTQAAAQNSGREFAGIVIAPGATSSSGVETGQQFVNENYADGDQIVIYGYSYGADVAMDLATQLGESGITVNTLVTVDGSDGPLQNSTVNTSVSDNVMGNLNVYQTNDSGASSSSASTGATSSGSSSGSSSSNSGTSNSPGSNGGPNKMANPNSKSVITNMNVTAPGVTHGNIQEKQQGAIQGYINNRIQNYYLPIPQPKK